MRYFIKLSYNGRPFHGWQSQPNAVSVQQTIEEALSTVLRQKISIVGAGRTDTGVHASKMFAHFDCDKTKEEIDALKNSLNTLIGRNIAIDSIFPVKDDAHARFDAESRTYKYYVTHNKSPFLYDMSWYCPAGLDYKAMNNAARLLLQTSDFTSFAKLHSDARTNICKVTEAKWSKHGLVPDLYVFTITADRFLRNMVRAVVGTLVEVGRHKISIDDFKDIIDKKNRCCAGTSMPPQALFLYDIVYPETIYI